MNTSDRDDYQKNDSDSMARMSNCPSIIGTYMLSLSHRPPSPALRPSRRRSIINNAFSYLLLPVSEPIRATMYARECPNFSSDRRNSRFSFLIFIVEKTKKLFLTSRATAIERRADVPMQIPMFLRSDSRALRHVGVIASGGCEHYLTLRLCSLEEFLTFRCLIKLMT